MPCRHLPLVVTHSILHLFPVYISTAAALTDLQIWVHFDDVKNLWMQAVSEKNFPKYLRIDLYPHWTQQISTLRRRLASFSSFLGCFSSNFLGEISSTQAAITKSHRLGGLNNKLYFSQFWRLGNPRWGCQHGGIPLKTLFLVCTVTLLLCPHMTERGLWSLPLLLRTLIPS